MASSYRLGRVLKSGYRGVLDYVTYLQTTKHKAAAPAPVVRTWQTIFEWAPRIPGAATDANFAGGQVRITMDDLMFPPTTSKLRLTFAGSVDALADQTIHGFACTVGREAIAGDAYDFAAGTIKDVLFAGANTVTIPAQLSSVPGFPLVVSDPVDLTLNGFQTLVIAFTCVDGQSAAEDATGVEAVDNLHMYINGSNNDIHLANASGFTAAGPLFGNNYQWALYRVEAFA